MPISTDKIEKYTNIKISQGGQSIIDLARLVGVVDSMKGSHRVSNVSALPPAADNTGRFIFVEDIASYKFSDGIEWKNDYSSTITIGELYAWGYNNFGQLSDGTIKPSCSPIREITNSKNWCKVSAGPMSTSAIKKDGALWSWGYNSLGNLGDGTTISRCSPVREITSSTDWCIVSSGGYHTSAMKNNGTIWSWGRNTAGQLGNGTVVDTCSPVQEITSTTSWNDISAGKTHITAIKTDGTLWAWGCNLCGSLGDGTVANKCSPVREICSSTEWCQVSSGFRHTSAIKNSGELWVWGDNTCGKLGNGTIIAVCSPVREVSSSVNWCMVSAGGNHSSAIKTSGTLWSWGQNNSGTLGIGNIVPSCSPVGEFCSATNWCSISASCSSSLALKTSGEIWAWGANLFGNLGNGTVTSSCSPVREISCSTNWIQISTGKDYPPHSVALSVYQGNSE